MQDGGGESADDDPERQHEAGQHKPQIGGHSQRCRRQQVFEVAGEVDPGDGQQLERPAGDQPGECRQPHIDAAEQQSYPHTCGKHLPAPAGGATLVAVTCALGQGGGALRGHRRHREGQPLDVAGDAEQHVAETEPLRPGQHLTNHQQGHGRQPVAVQEAASRERLRAQCRSHPIRDLRRHTQRLTHL